MNIGQIIKEAGLKATPQRKMIYELMIESGHSSVDEIIAKIQQQNTEITVSTIYRILDSFCKAGLLSKMNHPSGKCYYDITLLEHHHIFRDNEIIDYIDSELTTLIKNHLKEKSFKHLDSIEKISVQIKVNS
jgi:Fe2+ or Zn2+ uptake regulation protein